MKNLFTLFLISLTTFLNAQTATLKGTVTDETDEVVLFATVVVYQDGIIKTGTHTDFDGNYQFDSLAVGTYDVEVRYVGYPTKKINNIVLFADKTITLNIEMRESTIIDCPIYISPPSLYEADKLTQGTIFFSKEIQRSPHKN